MVPASGVAKDVVRWKCPTVYTSVMPDYKVLQEVFKNLKVMSNGRLVIKLYPSGALLPSNQVYDGVRKGTVEMGVGYPNFWFGKNVAWALLNDQPFGFRKKEAFLMWYYEGGGIDFANELTKPDNILWLPGVFTGSQTGAFCGKPIRTLAEAKGKKFRIGSGIHMEALQNAGIQPTNLAPQEIYGALDRGVVDMVEWTTPSTDYFLKFHEVAPYVLGPAWWQPTGLSDFLINLDEYNKLPVDLQEMLKVNLRDASIRGGFRLEYLDSIYKKKLEEEGVTFYRWTEEDKKVLQADVEKIKERYANESPLFKKIWESQKAFLKTYNDYQDYVKF